MTRERRGAAGSQKITKAFLSDDELTAIHTAIEAFEAKKPSVGPLAVNQDMLCAKLLMQAIEYKIKAKDLVARVCRAEKRRAAAARSCCAPSGSSTIMLCANAADGLKGSTLRLGRMLASEMAAKVIDCGRNNDLGPLQAQISEGGTRKYQRRPATFGRASSEQHSTGLRNLF